MSASAMSMPRIARATTGGPKWDRDRVARAARGWWDECRQIMRPAGPFVPVPSPVPEALADL